MKLTEFVIIVIAAVIFLVPIKKNQSAAPRVEAQEEAPQNSQKIIRRFKLTYEVTNPRLEEIADIIWMKKAAEVAIDAGIPFFNIVEQKKTRRFIRNAGQKFSFIQGIIELDPDPMRAEFDAQEIESLVLTEYPE